MKFTCQNCLKKTLLPACLLIGIVSSNVLFAHNSTCNSCYHTKAFIDTLPVSDKASAVFETVEVEAEYQGGETAWRNFIISHLNPDVPVKNHAPAGSYTVVVQFVVDKDGLISEIKPLTKYGYGMEHEVVRMLQQSPKWSPAQQHGRPVKAYRKQPITFVVQEEKRKRKLF